MVLLLRENSGTIMKRKVPDYELNESFWPAMMNENDLWSEEEQPTPYDSVTVLCTRKKLVAQLQQKLKDEKVYQYALLASTLDKML